MTETYSKDNYNKSNKKVFNSNENYIRNTNFQSNNKLNEESSSDSKPSMGFGFNRSGNFREKDEEIKAPNQGLNEEINLENKFNNRNINFTIDNSNYPNSNIKFQNSNNFIKKPQLSWQNRYDYMDQIKLKKIESTYQNLLDEHINNIKQKQNSIIENTKEIYLYDHKERKMKQDFQYNHFKDITDLDPILQENITSLKYSEMTKIQKIVIPCLKNKNDIIACAETGSGKTVAYSLPILNEMIFKGPPNKLMIPSKF